MTYALARQHGVGLGQAPLDPRDTSGIVPPECARLGRYVPPPATTAPGQVLVVAFPKVTYSGDPIPGVLQQILGANGEGGSALFTHLATGGRAGMYSFVGGGWMRDTQSDQAYTKGTLWLALSPTAARSTAALRNDAKLLLDEALRKAGLPSDRINATRSAVDFNLQLASMAEGTSDDQLRLAAYRAAGGIGQFASFIRYAFGYGAVGRAGATISDGFRRAAAAVNGAQQLVQGAQQVADAARSQATQSLSMEPAPAMQMLQNVERLLKEALTGIKAGVALAPRIPEFAAQSRTSIASEVRRRILDAAESRIASQSPLEIAREFYRCATLTEASRQVQGQLDAVASALDGAVAASLWLANNSDAITAAEAQLIDALGKVKYAMEQVPMGFWLRTRFGLPTWGWGALGVAGFIGGAVVLRRARKKKVAPNRRRRRRLR